LPRRKGGAHPDRDFSANPSNDKIDTNIDDNLFTSLVAGYSELIDDSGVRFRIGEIINRALSKNDVK